MKMWNKYKEENKELNKKMEEQYENDIKIMLQNTEDCKIAKKELKEWCDILQIRKHSKTLPNDQ